MQLFARQRRQYRPGAPVLFAPIPERGRDQSAAYRARKRGDRQCVAGKRHRADDRSGSDGLWIADLHGTRSRIEQILLARYQFYHAESIRLWRLDGRRRLRRPLARSDKRSVPLEIRFHVQPGKGAVTRPAEQKPGRYSAGLPLKPTGGEPISTGPRV